MSLLPAILPVDPTRVVTPASRMPKLMPQLTFASLWPERDAAEAGAHGDAGVIGAARHPTKTSEMVARFGADNVRLDIAGEAFVRVPVGQIGWDGGAACREQHNEKDRTFTHIALWPKLTSLSMESS